LFRLHKFFYLLDCQSLKANGNSITDFVYIRQKDGPYCVELGSRWFTAYQDEIKVVKKNGVLHIIWINRDLFANVPEIDDSIKTQIDRLLSDIDLLSDAQLKARAYLTPPMREALKAERKGIRQLNKPLL